MKLMVKTLKNQCYEIEVENEKVLIKNLKDKVRSELDLKATSLKLLYNGIILDDKNSLEHYKIYENSVIIAAVIGNEKKSDKIADEQPKQTKVNDLKSNSESNNNLNKYKDQLKTLSEMGFDQSKCLNAIIAANGSISIAIEYLYNGIPPNLGGINQQINNNQYHEAEDNQYQESEENNEDQVGLGIDQILTPEILDSINLNDPNSLSIIASVVKVIMNQNGSSEILQEIIEYIQEESPEISEYIEMRQNEFSDLLSKPLTNIDLNTYNNIIGLNGIENPNSQQIEEGDDDILEDLTKDFTEKDNCSIDNIVSLGFSVGEAIEAYLACDKNEENAVDFLLQGKQ